MSHDEKMEKSKLRVKGGMRLEITAFRIIALNFKLLMAVARRLPLCYLCGLGLTLHFPPFTIDQASSIGTLA